MNEQTILTAVSAPTTATMAGTDGRSFKLLIRVIAVVLAVLGWWISLDLLRLSGGGRATNPWLQAACGADGDRSASQPGDPRRGASNCFSILASERARVGAGVDAQGRPRLGLPWAGLGMAYFAFVGVWYLLVGPPTRRGLVWHGVVAFVVGFGALSSAQLVYAMAYELHRWCVGCVAAHAINAGLLVLTLLAFPWRREMPARPAYPAFSLGLTGLVAAAATGYGHVLSTQLMTMASTCGQLQDEYTRIVSDAAYVRWRYDQQPVVEIPVRDDEAWLGAADASNTVIVFVDFQCYACKLASETLAKVCERQPGWLRVAYRHFPQDSTCNPHFQGPGHPAACNAALAAEAARVVGGADGFLKMRSLMYERQRELESAPLDEWASTCGLSGSAVGAAMILPPVAQRVRDDVDLGAKLGVRSTPALFLNGRRVEHWRSLEAWDTLLKPAADR